MQMPGDLAGAHPPCIHRHDLVIEPGKPPLVFGDQLRLETRLPVARHIDGQLAGVGHHRLATIAVAGVAGAFVAGKMVIHLRVQCTLGQRLLQRIQQASRIKGFSCGTTRQQPVEQIMRYHRFLASRHMGSPFYPLCPTTHEIPDSPCAGEKRR
jgi:hypothetical protein